MQVTMGNNETNIDVQTITLQPEEGNRLYAFHCTRCGNFHSKIGGKVSKIYPIHEPSGQVPAINRCRRCGQEYTFQTHDGYSSEKIKVLLNPKEEMSYFYCYRGKDLILEYDTKRTFSYVENRTKQAPFLSQCVNPSCPLIYYFTKLG